jgi:signal transduction histidine kinase
LLCVLSVELDTDPHTLLRLIPLGVLVVAHDWRVRYANPEAERLLGAKGTTLWERCPDLEHTGFASGLRYAMADRTELLTESALPAVGWLQVRARALQDGGLLVSVRQVHPQTIDTSQAKQALLVGELGDALTREDSLRASLVRCATALVRYLDATLVRIWTVDDGTVLEPHASAGNEPGDRLPRHSEIARIAEHGTPFLTNDAQALDVPWLRQERITAFAGYPLRVEDTIVGVLALYSRRQLDHDLLNSLSSVASSLALGIARKSADVKRYAAEAALRKHAEQREVLFELGKQLAGELDVGALAQQIVDTATRLAGAQVGVLFYTLGGAPGFAVSGIAREAFVRRLPRSARLFDELRPTRIADLRRVPPPREAALISEHVPIASFLAMPLGSRTGRMIGGLLFGDPRAGAFGDESEALIANVGAAASIAMDNARLFKEAHDLIAALEKSNRELDQFAYVASHDLKAPLRGIASLSQWIEEDLGERMTDETRSHLQLLRGRVIRLENLIGGILAYSRAGKETSERVVVPVGELVHELWELLSPPKTAHLEVLELPTIVTSRTQLEQVLMNLIGNAIKYNPNRNLHITVGVNGDRSGGYEFFVRDDGIGIAPEFHDKIWGLFQTLERRDKTESTGIGLSIVRKIVEAQGGRAWVESRLDEGATFRFTWPAERSGEQHG